MRNYQRQQHCGSEWNSHRVHQRADVKAAIHAPADVDWTLCANIDVFSHGDKSLPSALTVLPNVIEKSSRSLIVYGLADFLLIAEGARIVLQKCVFYTVSVDESVLNNVLVRPITSMTC